MKRLRITVNNKVYDVMVDVLEDDQVPVSSVEVQDVPITQPVAPPPTNRDASSPVAAAGEVVAPMAGSVLHVKVSVGDEVNAQQTLIVLEAMKMETQIVSSQAGHIESILVKVGDAVQEGQILIKIK